jgi:hypothetical protein
MSRRSLLSREAGSLVAHTKVLRLLIENAGRTMPPEVGAALLTVEGWAVDLVAAERKDPMRRAADLEDSSVLMAEIRSTLAILSDHKLEVILRDLPYRRMYSLPSRCTGSTEKTSDRRAGALRPREVEVRRAAGFKPHWYAPGRGAARPSLRPLELEVSAWLSPGEPDPFPEASACPAREIDLLARLQVDFERRTAQKPLARRAS